MSLLWYVTSDVRVRVQLVNLWQYRYGYNGESGVIPMHMDSVEAMEFVSEKGVEPNLVYIDGDRRYKVRQRACHATRPGGQWVPLNHPIDSVVYRRV